MIPECHCIGLCLHEELRCDGALGILLEGFHMLLDTRLPSCLRLGHHFGGLATAPASDHHYCYHYCLEEIPLGRKFSVQSSKSTLPLYDSLCTCHLSLESAHVQSHLACVGTTLSIHYLLAFPSLIASHIAPSPCDPGSTGGRRQPSKPTPTGVTFAGAEAVVSTSQFRFYMPRTL